MQVRDTRYLLLDDGRKLCLECLDSAIMDTHECQPLYLEIQEFYEGLNMKVEQQIPLLLVERQALNEAMEGEKNVSLLHWKQLYFYPSLNYVLVIFIICFCVQGHHHMPETRGLCLSEEQTVSTVGLSFHDILPLQCYIYICVCACTQILYRTYLRINSKYQIIRRPRIGANYRIMDMFTEPLRLVRRCEVTAILILYSLPR